jgi:hypothetical protein
LIKKARLIAPEGLEGVLDAEERAQGDPGLLGPFLAVGGEQGPAPAVGSDDERVADVSQKLELREGEEAARRPRIPGGENEIAFFDRLGRPAEKMRGLEGSIVLINPEEGDVEVVAGVGEIVGVAAKKGCRVFGGENQPDISIDFILVERLKAAGIKADHLATQAGLLGRVFFEGGDEFLPGGSRIGRVFGGCLGCPDVFGHILDVL